MAKCLCIHIEDVGSNPTESIYLINILLHSSVGQSVRLLTARSPVRTRLEEHINYT